MSPQARTRTHTLTHTRARAHTHACTTRSENLEGEYSGLEHEVVEGVVESLKVGRGGSCWGWAWRWAWMYAGVTSVGVFTSGWGVPA